MRRARAVAPLLAAAALGALAAFGQAPWGAWYLTVPAMAAVLLLIAEAPTRGAAALRGWLAGAAQFAIALSWIVEPFLVDLATHGWMAPFALILMAGGLALFWAAAAWLGHGASSRRLRRLWLTALALLVSEALRGVLFTGFPWALVGHVWIGTPVDQIAALGGALLLSALTLGLAAALGTAWLRAGQRRFGRAGGGLVAGLAVLGSVWGWGAVVLSRPDQPARDGVIRLVQGNVPQHLKWQPDLVQGFFQRHLDLSARPRESPLTLVIWPESAAPFLLDNPGIGLDLASRAADAPLVLGLDRSARSADGVVRYFNALAHLDETGAIRAVYDKHHLVPFGEYIPLIGEAAQGWGGLASRVFSGYAPGPGPVVLDLGDAGRVLPLICYEVVFPRNLRTAERPDYILQITNDAWFGTWSGPYQHLAQARLRAIEFGLPLVRSANTGVSAVIDARGRITRSLPLGEMGVLDATVPGAHAATPYARTGDLPWHVTLLLALAGLIWRSLRRRKAVDADRQPG